MNETPNRLTYEDGTTHAYSGIELGHADQVQLVNKNPHFPNKWIARLLQRPGDLWMNKYVRVLPARYDTNERDQQFYRWVFSFSIPSENFGPFGNNLLVELHHRANLYNIPGLGVAPIATTVDGGSQMYTGRVSAGKGTDGSGYAVRRNDRIKPIKFDVRTDLGWEIKFSEGNDGHFYIWINDTGVPDPDMFSKPPDWKHDGPTLPYSTSGQHVGAAGLYQEGLGMYSGASSVSSSDGLDSFGSIREQGTNNMKAAIESIGAAGPAPPPVTPPATPMDAHSTIQNGDSLAQGTYPWTFDRYAGVSKVEFYAGGKTIGVRTSPPFTNMLILDDVPVGAYPLGLDIYDSNGKIAHAYRYSIAVTAATAKPINLKLDRFDPNVVIWANWTKVPKATSYQLWLDGNKVSTAGPDAVEAKFEVPYGDHFIEVEPLPAGVGKREGQHVRMSQI